MRKSSRAMSIRGSAFSTPWLQFHGGGAADVYIIIRVRACCCGESALNPPTSQPIPVEDLLPPRTATRTARAFSHPLPAHFHSPRSDDARPPTTQHIPRRRPPLAPAQRHALPEHFRSPTQSRRTPTQSRRAPADCAMHSPPTSRPIPRRRPSLAPAAPPCLPLCSASGTKKRHRTVDVRCRMSRSTVVAVGHWGW